MQGARIDPAVLPAPDSSVPPAAASYDNNVTKHVYIATHDRTQPPADQVVTTERQNILLRQFHARNESRRAQKRMTSQSSESTSLVAPAPKRPRDASRGAANS